MDEIQNERMNENVALGEALLKLLGDMYGCGPDERLIKRGVYKYTDCGAWINFTETGVKIGSIVEGSDADTQSFDISYNGDDETFKAAYWAALQQVEDQADELWQAANGDESDEN